MEPASSSVLRERAQEVRRSYRVTDQYVRAVVPQLVADASKLNAAHITTQIQRDASLGRVDDRTSPGRNVATWLAIGEQVGATLHPSEQLGYLSMAHNRKAELLERDAQKDPDGIMFYQQEASYHRQEAERIETILSEMNAVPDFLTKNPEDQFVDAVKEVAIFGKFPQGLTLRGKELVPPGRWADDYQNFKDNNYQGPGFPYRQARTEAAQRMLEVLDRDSNEQATKVLKDKHFLFIVPFVPRGTNAQYPEGHSLLIFSALQDTRIRDSSYRHARHANVYFVMPNSDAQRFIDVVKEREDGADVAMRFLQKAAPGALAQTSADKGIHWVQSSELVVCDDQFQMSFLTEEMLKDQSSTYFDIQRGFLNNVNKAVRKPYSQPVGVGTPP